MNVGKNILAIRKSNDLSQEQFGQLFHVTRQTVSNWEKEKSFPDLQTLIRISNRFDVSFDQLIKEDTHLVQTIDRHRKFAKWSRLITGILIAALLVMGFVTGGQGTPNEERNRSETDAAMYLNLPDQTPSRAIVRTFDKEEWEQLSQRKRAKIIDELSGRIEGDMPCLHVLSHEGNPGKQPKIRPVFQDLYQNNRIPDRPAKVTITAYENCVKPFLENKEIRQKKWQAKLQQDEDGFYFQIENPFGEYDQKGEKSNLYPAFWKSNTPLKGTNTCLCPH